jgi:serpin B
VVRASRNLKEEKTMIRIVKAALAVTVGSMLVLAAGPDVVAQDKADKAALVKGNSEFAIDLFGKLRSKPGNLFLSPYSISTALAMTSVGARGQTLDQMTKTLHFLDQKRLHPAFTLVNQEVTSHGKPKGYQLSVANALWGQKGYGFLNDFLTTTQAHYQAGLHEVDFIAATDDARKTINAWVEKETRDKIKDLLKPGVLNRDTRLVLTNAIYFKGDWDVKFKKELTKTQPWLGTAQKQQVPLMYQKGKFKYLDGGTFQALEMPYVGKELAMLVLLPKKTDGLAELEKSLTPAKLGEWVAKLREQDVEVHFPKFKCTSEFSLKQELSALGMTDAFTAGADFSGINGKKDLYIQDVVHKAFVEVNEEGTEAAAATGVVVGVLSARIDPVFRADHPFLFLIRDTRNGSILFLGRLSNPE